MAVRLLLAVLMGMVILAIGIAWLRSMVNAPPPDAEPSDVSAHNLRYVCTMCGLELRVERAAIDKAPSHCGEKMVLVSEGGAAPLGPA